MQALLTILPYLQIVISVLIVAAILLQQSSSSLGGAFGGSDNFSSTFHTRRGFERTLFFATILLGLIFIISSFITRIK